MRKARCLSWHWMYLLRAGVVKQHSTQLSLYKVILDSKEWDNHHYTLFLTVPLSMWTSELYYFLLLGVGKCYTIQVLLQDETMNAYVYKFLMDSMEGDEHYWNISRKVHDYRGNSWITVVIISYSYVSKNVKLQQADFLINISDILKTLLHKC